MTRSLAISILSITLLRFLRSIFSLSITSVDPGDEAVILDDSSRDLEQLHRANSTMRFHESVLLFLLSVSISEATLFSRSASLVSTTANRAHHAAIRRSAGLARDIRAALGFFIEQRAVSSPVNRAVYCVANQAVLPLPAVSNSGGNHTGHSSGGISATRSGSVTSTSTSTTPSASSAWTLTQTYQGNTFFNGWSFWNTADPTHGIVNYVDQATAQSNNLISINSAGNALMQVETTPTVASNRMSIRIQTTQTWNGGLFIMDSVHMPTGCGTWPAFWTNGPNWPAGGEIDIIEGVNDYTNNQATIHTNPGCSLATTNTASLSISGTLVSSTDCSAADTGNQGCGVRAASNISYGPGFNANGGGVYAMQWDTSGIAVYFFPRGSIPADITAGAPVPSNWGLAMARWPATSCDPFKFFYNNIAIFDTTLCGDWAAGVWGSSGIPGQEQSCATRTGYSTCDAFVLASGSSFTEAYWEVKSLKVYQTQ